MWKETQAMLSVVWTQVANWIFFKKSKTYIKYLDIII